MDLKSVIEKHGRWLRGEEGGERANLRVADLRGANLRSADLRVADLHSADLCVADLCVADLRGADLSGADLRGADLRSAGLSDANLRGAKGFALLTQTDHGYLVYASKRGETWRIFAGCRDFSLAEARAHWSATDYHMPSSGRRVVACLDWFERELASGAIEG